MSQNERKKPMAQVEFDNAGRTYSLGSGKYDWGAYMLNDLFEFLQHRRTHTQIREQLENQWRIICDRRDEEQKKLKKGKTE